PRAYPLVETRRLRIDPNALVLAPVPQERQLRLHRAALREQLRPLRLHRLPRLTELLLQLVELQLGTRDLFHDLDRFGLVGLDRGPDQVQLGPYRLLLAAVPDPLEPLFGPPQPLPLVLGGAVQPLGRRPQLFQSLPPLLD